MSDFPFAMGARPDPFDAEDFKAEPLALSDAALVALPTALDNRHLFPFPVEDQEDEGACVGMAVAAAQQAAYGLRFSPPWSYTKGQLEDDVPDDDEAPYEGTTLRAGLKGWHKHYGLKWESWPFVAHESRDIHAEFPCSVGWPLLRYERLDAGILSVQLGIQQHRCVLVTGEVHSGWARPTGNDRIRYSSRYRSRGFHAYLLAGWDDETGYWLVRNSWGTRWGDQGHGWLLYDDFLANVSDAWVAVVENA